MTAQSTSSSFPHGKPEFGTEVRKAEQAFHLANFSASGLSNCPWSLCFSALPPSCPLGEVLRGKGFCSEKGLN